MVAGLLYLIGLITVLVCVLMAAADAPDMVARFTAAMDAGAGLLEGLGGVAAGLSWAIWPVLTGLLLMGFARIIMLLATIGRSLRQSDAGRWRA